MLKKLRTWMGRMLWRFLMFDEPQKLIEEWARKAWQAKDSVEHMLASADCAKNLCERDAQVARANAEGVRKLHEQIEGRIEESNGRIRVCNDALAALNKAALDEKLRYADKIAEMRRVLAYATDAARRAVRAAKSMRSESQERDVRGRFKARGGKKR